MLLGTLLKLSITRTPLVINYNSIERDWGFKLLGVYISNVMSWNLHVDYICARANALSHYLKPLKCAGLLTDRLAIYYSCHQTSWIPRGFVWHHSLKKYQTEAIEAIQKRSIRIIYSVKMSMPYWVALQKTELTPLSDRRDKLCHDFFTVNCLIHLIAFIICCYPLVTLK